MLRAQRELAAREEQACSRTAEWRGSEARKNQCRAHKRRNQIGRLPGLLFVLFSSYLSDMCISSHITPYLNTVFEDKIFVVVYTFADKQ